MADEPNKDGKQTSELDIIEGRAETLGDPVEVHLDDAGGKDGAGKRGKDAPAESANGKRPADGDAAGDGKGQEAQATSDEDMEALRRQVASERRRREAAEASNRESKERIQRFETESQSNETRLIESNLREAEQQKALARRAYVDASGSGDPEKIADAIDNLTAASARVNLFNEAKSDLEKGRGRRTHEGAVVRQEPERRQDPEIDPVDAAARTMSPNVASWVRSHPECITDPAIRSGVMRAHYRALGEGHEEGTPEYLASLESTLFPARRGEEGTPPRVEPKSDGERRDPEPQRRQQSAAAPVRSGGTSNNGGGTRRTVTLSPEQRAMADSMDISYQDYARNLVALENEGRLSKRSVN